MVLLLLSLATLQPERCFGCADEASQLYYMGANSLLLRQKTPQAPAQLVGQHRWTRVTADGIDTFLTRRKRHLRQVRYHSMV